MKGFMTIHMPTKSGGGGQCLWGRRGRDGGAPGGQGYVLGIASSAQFNSWDKPVSGTAEAIALALSASRWAGCPPVPEPKGHGFTTGTMWN
jgi:hypothetical protein